MGKNSRSYWNLKIINTSIKSILTLINDYHLLSPKILEKRIKNNYSLLDYISELLHQNYSNYTRQQKNIVDKIFEQINILETNIFYLIEHFCHFLKPYLNELETLDPSGTAVDRIKHKIKCAIEKYNDKWTTLEKRIKTDIKREIEKLRKNQCLCFSTLLDDEIFMDDNKLLERKFNTDINNNSFDWHFLHSPSPEEILISKEEIL